MIDQAIHATTTSINTATRTSLFRRTLSEANDRLEQLATGVETGAFQMNTGSVVLGLIFCTTVLFCGFFLSHNYSTVERRELAEAERNRLARETEKIQQMETYRSKMAKIIENYAIRLTNMTSALSPSSKHNSSTAIKRQIPNGSDDEIPIETITMTSDSSEDGESMDGIDDIDDDDELISGHTYTEEVCTELRSTLTIDTLDGKNNYIPSSSASTKSTITRANLREAVTDNPCAICLEPFKAGDDIVCCSNNVCGKKPHVFHQACSLDYIVTHTDGIQAPCPCCRKVLLPSEEQYKRMGCFRHSHNSALTLPELGEP